jgi:hypothetical protein
MRQFVLSVLLLSSAILLFKNADGQTIAKHEINLIDLSKMPVLAPSPTPLNAYGRRYIQLDQPLVNDQFRFAQVAYACGDTARFMKYMDLALKIGVPLSVLNDGANARSSYGNMLYPLPATVVGLKDSCSLNPQCQDQASDAPTVLSPIYPL